MKTVVYISYVPLTEKLMDDYYIDYLDNNHVPVVFFDISELYFKGHIFANTINRHYIVKIMSFQELNEQLRRYLPSATVVFPVMTFAWNSLRVFRLLSKHGFDMWLNAKGYMPVFTSYLSIGARVKKNLFRIPQLFTDRLKELYMRTLVYVNIIHPYHLVLFAGAAACRANDVCVTQLAINGADYDRFIESRGKEERIINYPYAVFLDDNLVYDSDYRILGIDTLQPHEYFPSIADYFSRIEKQFKVKVVVAAHPKSQYVGQPFGNRSVILGKTNDLVCHAEFVLAHYSTSIGFAVLHKKSIVLLSSPHIRTKLYYRNIEAFSQALGIPIQDMSAPHGRDAFVLSDVDSAKYESYKYEYLTTKESEGAVSKNIVFRYIQGL